MNKVKLLAATIVVTATLGTQASAATPNQVMRMDTNAQGQAHGLFQIQGPITPTSQAVQKAAREGAADSLLSKARAFFWDHQTMLGAGAGDLVLHKQNTDAFGNQHLRFYRTLAGIPVKDMEVLVHFDSAGNMTSVNGEIVQLSPALETHMASQRPRISEADALAAVATLRNTTPDQLRLLSAKQWLFNEAPHVRWHLDLNPENGIDRFSYWLDAETGALIDVQNTLRHPIPFRR
ncbi:zinc metalloproteinase aureolysin [Simiduia agarivorans]|uniref:Zinc metalloproteinase aureolysin n=1 Tax=Simiduia agarivorans (strain DSM 21679 / JCM 13881 / BCRC 17597 / SA1) TaxID=1117647 RepID=K4KM01_SIMAS|nr:zinc metalloproteinase aureolysin [Simiduia agarivorans]AFU99108.1 zinc metalloproteinase aureolysin [Simiduia agarivorans SA1 = DSM 21679]